MESIVVNRRWLVDGAHALPPVCLKTGVATDGNMRERKVSTAPAWIAVFIALGVIPYALVRAALGESFTLRLPQTKSVKTSHATSFGMLSEFFIALALIVIGAGSSSSMAFGAAFVAIVLGIVLAVRNSQVTSVGVRVKHKDPSITLSRVHPVAAQALVDANIAVRA